MGTDNIGRAIWGQTIWCLMFFVADGVVRAGGRQNFRIFRIGGMGNHRCHGWSQMGDVIWGQTIWCLMFFVADGVVRVKGLIDDGMEKHPSCYAVVGFAWRVTC